MLRTACAADATFGEPVVCVCRRARAPAFAPEELAKLKQQMLGYYQRQLESTDYRSAQAFSEAIYPAGHPNYIPPT